MAWPWLAIIARSVPWGELVKRTPDIIAASGKLLDKSKARGDGAAGLGYGVSDRNELSKRIQALEARDEAHAKIIAQMVEQMQGLASGLEVLAARNRLLLWFVAILAVVILATLPAIL